MQIGKMWILWLAAGVLCGSGYGQEKAAANAAPPVTAYDVRREVNLTGTVAAYMPVGQSAPGGVHVSLQSSAGIVDVHLGDARLLAANHFTIQPGDTLRIIGENVLYRGKTQFVARVVQKGTQAVVMRSVRGLPLSYVAPQDASKKQEGVQ